LLKFLIVRLSFQPCLWPGLYPHISLEGIKQEKEHKEKRFLSPARGLARGAESTELRGRRKSFLRANPRAGVLPAQLHSLPLVSPSLARRAEQIAQGASSAARAILSFYLLFIFLRVSAARVRSGNDEQPALHILFLK
jgi:hypothetical protein